MGWTPPDFFLAGTIGNIPEIEFIQFRVRLFELLGDLVRRNDLGPFVIQAGYELPASGNTVAADGSANRDGPAYQAIHPLYRLDQLVLPADTMNRILDCAAFVELSPLVFETWNLRSIEPHPSLAANFRGPPGTGKTMAAHAIASHLGKKILLSRLSDLESKYHGDGPKNLVALFESARAEDAVLFIDEAEALLSRRFSQPEQAAESAINSMRTELLMALDAYDGLIIFASNLPDSYDTAIESRLFNIDFRLPERTGREQIWRLHLPEQLPLAADVSIDALADVEDVSGRDIKMTVVSAAFSAARRGLAKIDQDLLMTSLLSQRASRPPEPAGMTADAKENIAKAVRTQITGTVAPAKSTIAATDHS